MPLLRDYIDPGGKMLARRLDQFCSTLESLGARLRGTIATAIGETLGGFVRDVAFRVLDEITQNRPGSEPIQSRWSELVPDTLVRENFDPDEHRYWADEEEAQSEPDPEEQLTRPAPERLPTALSAGLQAASWWLQRWSGRGRMVTTLAVGLVAAGIAYIGGPLAALVLGLAGTATQFTSLSDAFVSGTLAFGRSDPP